ncbi:hypothetical protein B0H10DRAFT_1955123 [Mycena sp. CBHHK59/15]|nr:hypothetical protein B0H10DRAFT_1955123 [Mycena sp. CBHHK59/15]
MDQLIAIDMPRAKRSHEEVVAADTERLARADAIAVKRAEMLAAIAALDVAQDAVMAGEEEHQIDSTTDLPSTRWTRTRLSSRNMPQRSTAAAASSKAGISKAWAYKATAGSTPLGGFTDKDAEATRPDFKAPETARAPRKNTMVEVFDVPDSDDTPTRAPGLAAKAKARASVKVESQAAKIPALAVRGHTTTKTTNIKSHVKSQSSSSPFAPASHANE